MPKASEFFFLSLKSELSCKIISQSAVCRVLVFSLSASPGTSGGLLWRRVCGERGPQCSGEVKREADQRNKAGTLSDSIGQQGFTPPNSSLQLLLAVFQCTKGTWLIELQELKLCNDYWEILAKPVWILWPFSTHWCCVCGVSAVRIGRRCGVYTAVHQQEDGLPSREQ